MNDQPNLEALREELVQVAAVAVAIIEDIDYDQANYTRNPTQYNALARQGDWVIQGVIHERVRQDQKWGPQSHTANDWLHILMEEVGEAAEEIRGEDPHKLRHVITNVGRGSKRFLKEKFGWQ